MVTPDMLDALQDVGTPVSFGDGDPLREKGAFAPDMLLIVDGHVDCVVSDSDSGHVTVGPGTIVGEIGFLTGQGATATLRAIGPVEALSLDAGALQALRTNHPDIAAVVLRHVAHLLQDRSTKNEALADPSPPQGVIRCSTLDQRCDSACKIDPG